MAAPGDLDPTFDGDGKLVTDVGGAGGGDAARAVAVQPDGKIVAAGATGPGSGALVRYNPAGGLDLGFGADGRVAAPISARDVAIQPDGAIVIAGRAFTAGGSPSGDFALARYRPDGSLDTGFGSGGMVVTEFPPPGRFDSLRGFANRVLIDPDGRILAGGVTAAARQTGYEIIPTSGLAVARYMPDGSLDAGFGSEGKQVVVAGRDYTPEQSGLARQPDGKVVLASTTSDGDFFVVRLLADGKFLDIDFNGSGIVRTNLSTSPAGESYDAANDVAIQSGKIVAAGYTRNPAGSPSDFALVRYNVDGRLDSSFDGDGKVVTDFGASDSSDPGPDDLINGLAIQGDGRIVAAGCASSVDGCAGAGDFALARYNVDGSLDTSFGASGKVTTAFGAGLDAANDVAIQPADGKLVAAGEAFNGTDSDFALARYFAPLPDPVPPPPTPTPIPTPPPSGDEDDGGRLRPNLLRPGFARAVQRGDRVLVRLRGRMVGNRGRSCGGRIKIGTRAGARRAATRIARMGRNCRYAKKYSFPVRRLPPRLRPRNRTLVLKIRVRYQGNRLLKPDLSPPRRTKVRR